MGASPADRGPELLSLQPWGQGQHGDTPEMAAELEDAVQWSPEMGCEGKQRPWEAP